MLVEGGGKYQVNLVNPNSNREDSIEQLVNALDNINTISCQIFSTLRLRLEEQHSQVQSLTQRVTIACNQVEAIQGSQKAIRIISPAKYPADLEEIQIRNRAEGQMSNGCFSAAAKDMVTLKPLVGKKIPVLGQSKTYGNDKGVDRPAHLFRFDPPIKHVGDLLSCYHVKNSQLELIQMNKFQQEMGLGRPPPELDSVDSFLLFNTAENPYKHYRVLGKSQTSGQLRGTKKGEEVQLDSSKISQTNKSAEISQEYENIDVDDFYYSPTSLQIPEIDVPEHLPDLPGIVENLDFTSVDNFNPFSIFQRPSTLNMSISSGSVGSFLSPSIFSSTPEPTSTSSTLQIAQPAPSSQISLTEKSLENKMQTPVLLSPPPPPPPPPAMFDSSSSSKDETKIEKSKSLVVSTSKDGGDDMRSSLMAAIRAAGGSGKASLSSAKDKKYEAKKKKQEDKEKIMIAQSSSGPDLMADLKNSLAMRRKGISGIQEQKSKQSGSGMGDIMLKLASTIPKLDESGESAEPDEDDETGEDDWD